MAMRMELVHKRWREGREKRKGGEERETTTGANRDREGGRRDGKTISEIRHIIKSAGCVVWSPFGSTRIRLITASDLRQI